MKTELKYMLKGAFYTLAWVLFWGLLGYGLNAFANDRYAMPGRFTQTRPQTDQVTPCTLGGKLAHDTYLQVTFDAQRPDYALLHQAVDWNGDLMHDGHDRRVAHEAATHIAMRLKSAGVRKPWPAIVYEAARETMIKECLK